MIVFDPDCISLYEVFYTYDAGWPQEGPVWKDILQTTAIWGFIP